MNDDLQFTVQTEGHTVIFRVKDDVDMNGAVFTQVVEATIVLPEARDLKVMVSSYRRFSGKGMDLKKALDDVYSLVENTSIRHFVMVAANEYSLQALFARVMSGGSHEVGP